MFVFSNSLSAPWLQQGAKKQSEAKSQEAKSNKNQREDTTHKSQESRSHKSHKSIQKPNWKTFFNSPPLVNSVQLWIGLECFGSFFYVFLLSEGSNINQSTLCISLPRNCSAQCPVLRQQNWGVPEVRNQKGWPVLTNHIETTWSFCIPDHRATPWVATISQDIPRYSNNNTTLTDSAIWVHMISHGSCMIHIRSMAFQLKVAAYFCITAGSWNGTLWSAPRGSAGCPSIAIRYLLPASTRYYLPLDLQPGTSWNFQLQLQLLESSATEMSFL